MSCGIFEWILNLGDSYYEAQTESIAAVGAKFKRRNNSSAQSRMVTWAALYDIEEWDDDDWEEVEQEIEKKYATAANFIRPVIQMMEDMGYGAEEAVAFVQVFCTERKIPDNVRSDMVKCWTDYQIISNFTDKTVLPLENSRLVETTKRALYTRFKCLAASCLPLDVSTEDIERALSKTELKIEGSKMVDTMMSVSKVQNVVPHKPRKEREMSPALV